MPTWVHLREAWTGNNTAGHHFGTSAGDNEKWDGTPLDQYELSAYDLGCLPGTEYVIELIDDEDNMLADVTVTAT